MTKIRQKCLIFVIYGKKVNLLLSYKIAIITGMETLSKLFGSETKVKTMRLFLFNPENSFNIGEISDRVKSDSSKVRREVSTLEKMGMVKKKTLSGKSYFYLNKQFEYLGALQNFLVNTEPLNDKELIKKITKLGSVKLIITAGVFIQEPESRVDILVVGDNIKTGSLDNTIRVLESEIGKELRYTYFTSEDFRYRLSMCDKLTRDILDYPHRKVFNKLGIL